MKKAKALKFGIIASLVIGAVFIAAAVFELCLCIGYITAMGAGTMPANEIIAYLTDQCVPPFGLGTLHLAAALLMGAAKQERPETVPEENED